ncbi:MAG: hypothetical protein F4X98_08325 [Gammaproteobacteria bacterium]|nr:hypothetical protein [Gammaproteobacteria bacterium]
MKARRPSGLRTTAEKRLYDHWAAELNPASDAEADLLRDAVKARIKSRVLRDQNRLTASNEQARRADAILRDLRKTPPSTDSDEPCVSSRYFPTIGIFAPGERPTEDVLAKWAADPDVQLYAAWNKDRIPPPDVMAWAMGEAGAERPDWPPGHEQPAPESS